MKTLSSTSSSPWLPWFLRGICVLFLLFLFIKLFEIQIIKGEYYKTLSNGNRMRKVSISAPRGKILDRFGKVLIDNKEIEKKIIFNREEGYKKVGANENMETPGDTIKEWERIYPLGLKFAHVGGYVGEINEEDLGKIDSGCSEKGIKTLGMIVGKTGLEKTHDCTLRGIDGEELIEVNTAGVKVRSLGIKQPLAGGDLKTNIDLDLQMKVADAMKDKKGSVIVTNTKGEILSYYSSPSYDPQAFLDKLRQPEVRHLLENVDLPLFDRVIQGTYHPGSTYKLLVSLAGLEEGVIDEYYMYNDEGVVSIKTPYGDYYYKNWYLTQYGGREGLINVKKALGRSTDTFFYKLGESLGVDNLVKWSEKAKLNVRTGVDLPGEASSLVPSPLWKEREKNEKWFLGNTYHMAIGQGDLAVTPLQVNMITNIIASGGKVCQPRIVGEGVCEDLNVKTKNIEIVKEGMEMACSNGGTAYPFFDFKPGNFFDSDKVACKTGTAQTVGDTTHAWFTMFYPSHNPKVTITVFIEKGGEGSKEAAPVARDIMDYWATLNR